MKQLIKTIEQDEYSNKYYYNKMIADFELESRYNSMMRAIKNKWKSVSLKYIQHAQNMKEKTEENYINKMTNLQKSLDDKEYKIKKKISENQRIKEEVKKQSHEFFSDKEKRARETYNRKLKMDEFERKNNEIKLMNRSKK